MSTKKNAPSNLVALLNKKDTIIALLMIALIGFLWFETTKFEKVPDLFSNNIPPEMFPQIVLIIILGMILIIPFEHIFLKRVGLADHFLFQMLVHLTKLVYRIIKIKEIINEVP